MNKKILYSLLSIAALAILAIAFFYPDDIQGNVLQQHDTLQGIANGQEVKAWHEATGENPRWTNSLFSGMPNFQISPSYPANNLLQWLGGAFMLWLPQPAGLLFAMMFGFFIMCLCLKMKWPLALFASIAWGFSSYFIIIIGAGHIWKFVTLAYIPPTIGGLALLYRGKYAGGSALTALFAALQLQSNHPQMTYYFLFVAVAMVLAWLWDAIKAKEVKQWWIATGLAVVCGALAVGANSASLYNSYEYSKETVRGRATDLVTPGSDDTGGMDRDAITAWSYGTDETFTLLMPNVKGGASVQPSGGTLVRTSVADTDGALELGLSPEELYVAGQFGQYFGNQPMTNGPVYVGAFVLLLAILALFMVKGSMKWALFGVSVFALLLSWGHNFPAFTNMMIDYFPAYNKFRAVASILVIVEFTVPLLAAMCIKEILDHPERFKATPWTSYTVFGFGAGVCLLTAMNPAIFGDPFSSDELEMLSESGILSSPEYSGVINAIIKGRLSLVRADALRSLLFIVLGSGVLLCWMKGWIKSKPIIVGAIALLTLIDLYNVDHRYINSESFTEPMSDAEALTMTDIDRAILRDTTNYRVLDIPGMSSARSSYFHHTIGGYHAAKLTRYNDLLENQIAKGNMGIINMLNAKYIIDSDTTYSVNPDALGNAWWAHRLQYVENANAEMSVLDTLNTRTGAVADSKFRNILGEASAPSPGDTIYETHYSPGRLSYHAQSAHGGVAVMSEIYFPWGWEATIDGTPVEIARVNYVLRAVKVPAGSHTIQFEFNPKSMRVTNAVGVTCVVLIYILCGGALAWICIRHFRKVKERQDNK